MDDGFLSAAEVLGVELKRKGPRNAYFIWVRTDAVDNVKMHLVEHFG